MRQPRFRGFGTETKSWHYGHGWFESDYTDEYLAEKGIKQQAMLYTDGYPVECELTSMGEFTGLKDVNGKEIYEGDILTDHGEEGPLYIEYSKEHAAFVFVDKFDPSGTTLYTTTDISYGQFEVIGNVFENSGLLK